MPQNSAKILIKASTQKRKLSFNTIVWAS
jgi:hypothetical protein